MNKINQLAEQWLNNVDDLDVKNDLLYLKQHPKELKEAFYRDLAFGTGGLRGILGAGTNRMNVYTVAKASQGLANYINKRIHKDNRAIAVSYDSRIKSDLFAKVAARVFAANGLKVYIYPTLMPTPCLSFAVRFLNCVGGIMITASHNPAEYNGYKVYGPDGCQITMQVATDILGEIEKLDIFKDIRQGNFDQEIKKGRIQWIDERVYSAFTEEVKKQSLLGLENIDKNVSIVYTPLNGAGLKPVLRALNESGFTNITLVKEQQQPNGNFPTCPKPNPELPEAMALGLEYAKKLKAELLLATDPDCDRVGIAVRTQTGNYKLLNGNETGMLLLDYICSRRKVLGKMPPHPIFVKTIVTSSLLEKIASHYGVQTINVLTGFKFIGEQIGVLERQNRVDDFIFGSEESYGFLSGYYVRDKDAVAGSLIICEMLAYYKAHQKNLAEHLEELYKEYGYVLNTLHSYECKGEAGLEYMRCIMDKLRSGITSLAEQSIIQTIDFKKGINGLPPSDVLQFKLASGVEVIVRPSGTEPKIKVYLSVCGTNWRQTEQIEQRISSYINHMLHSL